MQNKRAWIVAALESRPQHGSDRVRVLAWEARSRPKRRIEPVDRLQGLAPEREVRALDQASDHERIGRDLHGIVALADSHTRIRRVEQQDASAQNADIRPAVERGYDGVDKILRQVAIVIRQ